MSGRPRPHVPHFTDAVGGPARRTVVILLACVLGLQSADTGAIGALAAPLEHTFAIGNTLLGLLVTVSTLVGAAVSLPFGVLTDRRNRTRLLQVTVLIWGLATVVSAVSVDYTMLLLARVALGGVVATAGPITASLIGDLFPADERGRLYGYVLAGELVGAGAGILLAGGVSGFLGWRLSLGLLAVPAFVLAWALRRYLPEPARDGQAQLQVGATVIRTQADTAPSSSRLATSTSVPLLEDKSLVQVQAEESGARPAPNTVLEGSADMDLRQAVRYVLRVRTNVALIVASGLGYFFLQGFETFAELFLRLRFGVGQSVASLLFVVVSGGALIGVLISGRAADRLIRQGHTSARLAVAGVAYLATAVFFIPGALSTALLPSLPLLLCAGAAIGAVNPPLDAARLDVVPAQMWGRAEAVRTALRQVLQGIAPVIFGLVSAAFGGQATGLGAGVDTTASRASSGAGRGLELAFVVLVLPVAGAGLVLLRSRNRYRTDVVAARRSDERRVATNPTTTG